MGAIVEIYFNFRSPYCYIASHTMFDALESCGAKILWMPLGGWDGRSPPERAKVKVPLVRQDVQRICARLGLPFNAPPKSTEPSPAGAASLYAQEQGLLKPFIQEAMRLEWAEGKDIGQEEVLREVAENIGADPAGILAAAKSQVNLETLMENGRIAQDKGIIGVPTFVIGEEIFWGQDRLDYAIEHVQALNT